MPVSAPYICDSYLLAPLANGDAIITGDNVWINYVDPLRSSNVNSIGVETMSRGFHWKPLEGEVFAAEDIDVELLAIDGSYVLNYAVGDEVKP